MSTSVGGTAPQSRVYQKSRLLAVSSLALVMAGVNAAVRANIAGDLQRTFLDPIDKVHSAEMIATVLGVPFLGFAITIAIGSPLLDYIGMRLLLPLSGVCFTLGTLIDDVRRQISSGAGVYTTSLHRRRSRRRRLGHGRDGHQPADRRALSRREDGEAEPAARVVARRPRDRRPARRRDVRSRPGLAGQAGDRR